MNDLSVQKHTKNAMKMYEGTVELRGYQKKHLTLLKVKLFSDNLFSPLLKRFVQQSKICQGTSKLFYSHWAQPFSQNLRNLRKSRSKVPQTLPRISVKPVRAVGGCRCSLG